MRFKKENAAAASFVGHSLFHLRLPAGGVTQFLRIQPGEGRLLAWVTLLQVVMSVSGILVNNVAQTAFLKRYGADALPGVFMAEALITFLCTLLVGVLMERFRKIRVFTCLLLFYGIAMALVRLMIAYGMEAAYPLLYILKSQAVGILPILYWDILSDMFTTQQSKRLYTLISAGGVLGIMAGSLMTRRIADWIGTDNILLIFVSGMVLTALLNEMTERVAAVPLQSRAAGPSPKPGHALKHMWAGFFEQYRASALLKYMVLLLAIPNILLPLMDFQFNVLVDRHFASESLTLEFFGVFRGISNALMFVLLLVSGRVISKWGIPVSLVLHPVNYCLAFAGILFRFDIIAGVYARFSTEVLKTVLNNPARAVLYNFFPEQHRSMIRLVLRGGVVRISDFAGSGLLLLVTGLADPRMLSLIALPMAFTWVVTVFRLRQAYPDILIQSLKNRQIDWERTEADALHLLAGDPRAARAFTAGLSSEAEDVALVSAEVLARTRPDLLLDAMLPVIGQRKPAIQRKWLDLIRPENAGPHLPALYQTAESSAGDALPEWLAFLNRVDPENSSLFMEKFLSHPDRRVRAQALMGACLGCSLENRDRYRQQMDVWIDGDRDQKILALAVLKKTRDTSYWERVETIFLAAPDPETRSHALLALAALKPGPAMAHAAREADSPDPDVRRSALEVLAAAEPAAPAQTLVRFLKDPEPLIRSRAFQALSRRGSAVTPALLASLAGHSRIQQEETLRLLERIGAPHADLNRFVMARLSSACTCLACIHSLAGRPDNAAAGLLRTCLEERHWEIIELVLRILGILSFKDKMPVILQAVRSGRRKDIDNAVEAIETGLHSRLRNALIPHMENRSIPDRVSDSARALRTKPPAFTDVTQAAAYLLAEDDDPWIRVLCLYAAAEENGNRLGPEIISRLPDLPDQTVASALAWLDRKKNGTPGIAGGSPGLPALVEKALFIKSAALFKGIKLQDLLPVADSCRLKQTGRGDILLDKREKTPVVYLLCNGEFEMSPPGESPLHAAVSADLTACGFAGEMHWIDGGDPLFAVAARTPGQVLEIPGPLFAGLLETHPRLVLTLCRLYTRRMRVYQRLTAYMAEVE